MEVNRGESEDEVGLLYYTQRKKVKHPLIY